MDNLSIRDFLLLENWPRFDRAMGTGIAHSFEIILATNHKFISTPFRATSKLCMLMHATAQ